MPSDHPLTDLLLRWKERMKDGDEPTDDELRQWCGHDPELFDRLNSGIQGIQVFYGYGEPSPGSDPRQLPTMPEVDGYMPKLYLGGGGFGKVWHVMRKGGFAGALKFVNLAQKIVLSGSVRSLAKQ